MTFFVEVLWKPGDQVKIVPLERPGTITLVRWDGFTVDYYVNWWDEGVRRGEWLPAKELK